ncbi:MAG: hypothetical protein QW478_06180 [Candidatus Micrarchaeaceae archaeon]
MSNTNTSVENIERNDKRVWRKYNTSLVTEMCDTSFLTWNDDLKRENDM